MPIIHLEDHDLLRLAIPDILEVEGDYDNVLAVQDTYEAWALLHSLPLACLIQDNIRPDVDGLEFYRWIRLLPALRDVKVIMLSATWFSDALAQDLGWTSLIRMPFDPNKLVTRIRQLYPQPETTSLPESAARMLEMRKHKTQQDLISAIEDPAWQVRWAALWAARAVGGSAWYRACLARLQDDHPIVRLMAVGALAEKEVPEAIPHILPLMEDPDPWVARRAAEAIAGVPDMQDALLSRLADPNPRVRAAAVAALRRVDGSVVPHLKKALEDEDAEVRRLALWVMWYVEDAVDCLVDVIRNGDADMAWQAVCALERQGHKAHVPVLQRLLSTEHRHTTLGWSVSEMMTWTISQLSERKRSINQMISSLMGQGH